MSTKKTREVSPHTGQHEPVEHLDGRQGMIWRYEKDGTLTIKWADGTTSLVEWKDLEG